MTGTFNPVMAIGRHNFSAPVRFARIIASLRLGDASFAHFSYLLTRGAVCNELRPQPDMYGASVGRNGIGSDCRIASCLAAGLLPAIKPLASLGGYLWECRIRTGGSSDPYLREKVSALVVSVGRVDDPLYGSILASMISTCPSVLGGISPVLLVRPESNRQPAL